MPIRPHLRLFRAGRLAASAAALAVTVSAAATQPRFPDQPPVPVEELPGDDVPHGVIPADPPTPHAEPVPHDHAPPPPTVAPVPPAATDHHHAPGHGVPEADPNPVGPPVPLDHPPGHGPYADPHAMPFDGSHGPAPGQVTPIPDAFPFAPGLPPYAAHPSPFPLAPMRPGAPLAPLPPVEADPTLGPPPGTLGHTYYRPSRYIPHDDHPRVAKLGLTLPEELSVDQGPGRKIRVTVHDVAGQLEPLEGYVGDDGHWHFESEPLIPGLPHIYRVKVERVLYEKKEIRRYGRLVEQESETGSELIGVRFLRLIPGRIVTLEF